MDVEFLRDPTAASFKKDNALVVGDLHIGEELMLEKQGVHFPGAEKALGESLLKAYKKSRAKRIVLLGDIKASITYPDFDEYRHLREFFRPLQGIELHIAKGNHDSHLQEVLGQIGVNANIGKEILLDNAAYMHGMSLPSEQAMQRQYIFMAHLHMLVKIADKPERAWIISGIGRGAEKHYKNYNKNVKLVVAPAANSLLGGRVINDDKEERSPVFREGIFDFRRSKIYSTDGKLLGTVQKIARRAHVT